MPGILRTVMSRCSLHMFPALLALTLLLCSCAGKEEPKLPTEEEQRGLSGKLVPDAEMAFGKARVLWRRAPTSATKAEVCTDPEKAVELLNQSIELEPSYADAYVYRGLAKSDLGMREEAFDDLTQAILLAPKPSTYAYRALVSIRGASPKAAKRDLDYSLELQPGQFLAHNYMGVLALSLGEQAAACDSFDKGCSNGDCSFIEAARKEGLCR